VKKVNPDAVFGLFSGLVGRTQTICGGGYQDIPQRGRRP